MAAETSPSRHFDAVRRRQVIRGTASAFFEEPLVYSIQSVGCVLCGREDEDSIVGERSRDAKGKDPEAGGDARAELLQLPSEALRPNWDVSLEEASTEVDFDGGSPTSAYSPQQPVAEEAEPGVGKIEDSTRKPKRQRES